MLMGVLQQNALLVAIGQVVVHDTYLEAVTADVDVLVLGLAPLGRARLVPMQGDVMDVYCRKKSLAVPRPAVPHDDVGAVRLHADGRAPVAKEGAAVDHGVVG